MANRIVSVLVFVVTLTSPLLAQPTLNVPVQYSTIQAAITAAPPGALILVSPGTYLESINFLGKAITVRAPQGATVTTIVGGAVGRVVTFASAETPAATLDGFRITGGNGGILCQNSSPTITNCTISNNTASSTGNESGGGIRIIASTNFASPMITNCRITGNIAFAAGGGVYCECQNTATSTVGVTACEISNNTTLGVFCYQCPVTSGGGGLCFYRTGTGTCSPTIDRCTITDNSVSYYTVQSGAPGGGVRLANMNSAVVRSSVIRDNHCTDAGGGIQSDSLQLTVSNCLVVGNSAFQSGGVAIFGSGSSSATVQNCTIAQNTASAAGGIGLLAGSVTTTIVNSILWANTGGQLVFTGTATPNVTYSDISGGFVGLSPTNISVDPLFLDPIHGDFHVASNSPCRNAGTNAAFGLPATDLDSTPRIQGGTIDIGSDEVPVPTHPGSNENLDLYTWVDGEGDPLASTLTAPALSTLTVRIKSPGGAFIGSTPLLFGELFTTGSPPPNFGVPGVQLGATLFLMSGTLSAPPFTAPGLPPDGLTLNYQVPNGLTGNTLRMQGFVLAPNALNGVFASTAAHEVVFP